MQKKIENLVKKLNEARDAYYLSNKEIMSNKEYDDLFDELLTLERESGIILPDSPTQTVGATTMDNKSSLEKVTHEYPALSLDKVKLSDDNFEKDLKKFIDNKDCFLSFKLDGLTTVATYDNGKLVSAATRGNGIIGEIITENAKLFKGLPQTIPYKEHLVVRGESLITYSEFERINSNLEIKFKNPRNLASGTVRALDPKICSERQVEFVLFEVGSPYKNYNSKLAILSELEAMHFNVVERVPVYNDNVMDAISTLTNAAEKSNYPTDGLVITYDDIALSKAVGVTGHHSKAGLAIKWKDEEVETILRNIEWSLGRTGVLTPVAIFDTVDLEGTDVSRASLHNVSYIIDKDLRIGDTVTIYKANMIIPQIGRNISGEARNCKVKIYNNYNLPSFCPCCKEATGLHGIDEDVITLHCNNPFCGAKNIKSIAHMASRDCLNIVGLSEERITFLVENGYINNRFDVFTLPNRKAMSIDNTKCLNDEPGWGKKAVDNLINSILTAKKCDFVSFIHSMGIPNIGKGQAKLLKSYLDSVYDENILPSDHDGSYDLIGMMVCLNESGHDWSVIEGFGETISKSLTTWIYNNFYGINTEVRDLLKELSFVDVKPDNSSSPFAGLTFVITGSVNHFKNRDELQSKIESLGGKCSGSVSIKTSYLINNDVTSSSGKNKKAKELGVPIISEEDFIKMIAE